MNFTSFLSALQSLEPVLGPVVEPALLAQWTGVMLPKLQAQVANISNADEKFIASSALVFLDTVAQYYIKKV